MCLESALKRCFEFYKLVLKIRNDDYTIILLVKIRFSCCFSKWCWFEYIVLYSIWVQLYHFLCRQIPSSEFVLEFSFKSFSVYFVLFRSLFRCIDVPSTCALAPCALASLQRMTKVGECKELMESRCSVKQIKKM